MKEADKTVPRGIGSSKGRGFSLDFHRPACKPAASASTVGASKRQDRGNSTFRFMLRRAMTWMADNEWPPLSKKLSVKLISFNPRTSPQTAANCVSISVRGATKLLAVSLRSTSGAGKARRSTLPFGVIGKLGRKTKDAGVI